MAREYYAQRQNPDGSVTRYRTEEAGTCVQHGRSRSPPSAHHALDGEPREAQRVKFYSVDFTFSIL